MKDSFRDLTKEELLRKQDELRSRYFDIRQNSKIGHLDNPLEIREVRRKMARVNTIIREYELGMRKI